MAGYNGNFESWVVDGTTYDTFYIKFNELDKSAYQWGDYIHEDSMVILAVATGSGIGSDIQDALEDALGEAYDDSGVCLTTTSTTTATPPTTTTTTTTAP
jgi:hypothetical protein